MENDFRLFVLTNEAMWMINVLITIQSDDMLMHEGLIVFVTVRFPFCICFKDCLRKSLFVRF